MAARSWLGEAARPGSYLQLNVRLLRVVGLAPVGDGGRPRARLLWAALVALNAAQLAHLAARWGDMAALASAVPLTSLIFGGIFRITLYLVFHRKFTSCVLQVGEWFVAESPLRGLQPMCSRLLLSRWLLATFALSTPPAIVNWVAYPLLSEGRELVMPVLLPFSITSPLIYYAVFIYQCTCLAVSAYVILMTDILMATMLYLTSGQFAVLSDLVRCCRPRTEKGAATMEQQLARCVRHHDRLLRLVADLESVNWFSMAFNFGLQLIILSFLGYEALTSTEAEDMSKTVRTITYLALAVLQLFLLCSSADDVTAAQVEVGAAAYESDWVGAPRTGQRAVWMVAARASRLRRLTAGKVIDINLVLFTETLTKAFSYFTVLRQIKGTG